MPRPPCKGVFDDCKTNARCNQAYPDLEGRWKHLLNSMPKQAQFIHPRLGTDTSEKSDARRCDWHGVPWLVFADHDFTVTVRDYPS